VDIYLLKKYLEGACNSEEVSMIIKWLNSDGVDDKLLHQIERDLDKNLYFGSEINQNNDKLKKLLQDIYDRSSLEKRKSSRPDKFQGKTYLKIAASIIFVFASVLFLTYQVSDKNESTTISEKIVVKENDRGRKSTIFLPDGSVLYLNSMSSIKFNESQFDSIRIVYLTGEGFFEVARDSIHPFKVVVNNIEITALGTSFNVNSGEDEIRVSLVEGKVLLKNIIDSEDNAKEFFLNPGQELVYSQYNNRFTSLKSFHPRKAYGWKDGILYFDQANLPTVLQKLERWFDVDFQVINESPVQWRYTAQFHNQSLKNILESLSFSQNFKYEIEGKKVIIVFNSS
jgi:transmembrane sensor